MSQLLPFILAEVRFAFLLFIADLFADAYHSNSTVKYLRPISSYKAALSSRESLVSTEDIAPIDFTKLKEGKVVSVISAYSRSLRF